MISKDTPRIFFTEFGLQTAFFSLTFQWKSRRPNLSIQQLAWGCNPACHAWQFSSCHVTSFLAGSRSFFFFSVMSFQLSRFSPNGWAKGTSSSETQGCIQLLIASFSALSKSWELIPDLLPCGLVNVFSFYCCSTLKKQKLLKQSCLHSCLHLWQLQVSCVSSVHTWNSQAAQDRTCHTGFTVFCLSPSRLSSFRLVAGETFSYCLARLFLQPSRQDSSFSLAGETRLTA